MKIVDFLKRDWKITLYLLIVISIFAFTIIVFGVGSENFFDFIQRHFISPLGRYYTPVNSVVYGLTLYLAIIIVGRLLTFFTVDVDSKFIISVLPYTFIGSAARALNDAGVYDSILLVSPPIYFVVFGYTLMSLFISLFVGKKLNKPFHYLFSVLGLIPTIYLFLLVVLVGVPNLDGVFLIFGYGGGALLVSLPIIYYFNKYVGFESIPVTCLIIGGHLLDASATHVAVSYFGYLEQHPLPNFLSKIFGTTFVLIPIKFLALLTMIIMLDRYLGREKKQLRGMIKLTLLILGLAPGTRDLLRLAMLK